MKLLLQAGMEAVEQLKVYSGEILDFIKDVMYVRTYYRGLRKKISLNNR